MWNNLIEFQAKRPILTGAFLEWWNGVGHEWDDLFSSFQLHKLYEMIESFESV